MITVVLTIVVIVILAAIGIATGSGALDEAAVTKFKHEITEVKRGVEVVKLANSKNGIDEITINKNFKKVKVVNPPNNFVSFDTDELTAYLIDLDTIDYNKLKTGKKYKEVQNDSVTFDVDDVYIYDKLGTIFYVKGLYIEGNEKIYTADEKTLEGPIVTAENTENGIVEVRVTPTKNGEITSVTVGSKTATKKDGEENVFIAEVDRNGSYIVVATETNEEGSESSKTTVIVSKIEEDEDSGDTAVAPTIATIKINNGEPYTAKSKATLKIETDAKYMYIKHVAAGIAPTIPTVDDDGWKRVVESTEIVLNEGENNVFAWFKNRGNDTVLEADMQSIILDTRAPTKDAPTVQIFEEHSFRITCNQRDPEVGSGLMRIDIGYKLADDKDYTWVNVEDLLNPTIEVKNNIPNQNYKIISRAQDNVGHVSESIEYDTGKLNDIPGGVVIENNPTEGWTKRSTVVITYPILENNVYEKWYRLAGGEWKVAESQVETLYIEENMVIDAVVVRKTNGETLFGEIATKEITNIDNIPPKIGKVILDSEAGEINEADFRGTTQISDDGSGVVAYVVGTSEVEPTVWHYLQDVKSEETINFDVNVDNQTYIWVKDLAGNVAYSTFEIEYVDMTNEKIVATLEQTEFVYTSKDITPEPIVKDGSRVLIKDKHYELKYENNKNAGTATITITGKRAYKGEIKLTFIIKPYTPTIVLNNKTANYNRNPIAIDAPTYIVPTGAEMPTGTVTYTYYIDSALTTKTTSTHGAISDGGAPSKENTYYVVAQIAAAGNYTEATSNIATLIISSCPVEVTFDPNGGTTPESKRIMYLDKTYGNNGNLPTPTRTGYDFLGWYTAATGGTKITESTVVTISTAHSIYAQWKTNSYEVTLVAGNYISKVFGAGNYAYGSKVSIDAIIESNTGYSYSFSNWTSSNTSLVPNKTSQAATFAMPAGNITLTASATRVESAYSCKCLGCGNVVSVSGTYCSTCNSECSTHSGYKYCRTHCPYNHGGSGSIKYYCSCAGCSNTVSSSGAKCSSCSSWCSSHTNYCTNHCPYSHGSSGGGSSGGSTPTYVCSCAGCSRTVSSSGAKCSSCSSWCSSHSSYCTTHCPYSHGSSGGSSGGGSSGGGSSGGSGGSSSVCSTCLRNRKNKQMDVRLLDHSM